MKKYSFAVVALLLAAGNAYAIQNTDGNPNTKREISGVLGTVPYREYTIARYGEVGADSTSLSAGDVVISDTVSDDGVTVGLVGTVGSSDAVYGVVVSTVIQTAESLGLTPSTDYGRRNWGWVQVKGYCSNVNVVGSGAAAAGQALKASDTARNADTSVNTGTGVIRRVLGFAYDTGSNPEVWIDL